MGKGASSPLAWFNRTFSGSPLVAQIWVTPISIFNQMQHHEGIFHMKEMRQKHSCHSGNVCHNSALPLSPKALVYRLSLIQIYTINMQGLFCRYHFKYVGTHKHGKVRPGPMSQKEAMEQKGGFLNLVPSPSCCSVAMQERQKKRSFMCIDLKWADFMVAA